MPSVWTENIAVDADIDAADINEVGTNLDTIYTALGINRPACVGAGWVQLPVAVDDWIYSADFQEMRDVTDFAYDNRCPAFNATDYSGDEGANNAGVLSNDHGTYQSGYDSGVLTGEDGTYWSGYNTGVLNNDHGTYRSGYNTGVLNNDHGTYNSNYDSNVENNDHGTHRQADEGSYDGVNLSGHDSGEYSGAFPGQNGIYCPPGG